MSAPKNKLEQSFKNIHSEAGQPANEQERITYGVISKVNFDTSQVKVRVLKSDGIAGEEVGKGFLPLLNSLSDIHLRFGALREGLIVRIYWKGKLGPGSSTVVEVIGDEEHSFLKKQPIPNEILIGPFKIFSGGTGFF